ncbi:amidohydrolase [Cryptococcus wingfieldii CBS 7118]|uniref:Amidohydrolase n=1 Tax=Cryptococcus wingfieldii CBS 7118 TaxID=1295528 RepID=A0A1E3IIQ0_9TREE|nr:amidohydrolase [Cryptococcus wingfieldii CBS 7118]ODN88487.1 amidohydrolase [Cryptococcus wingfieldii CBS 7118]
MPPHSQLRRRVQNQPTAAGVIPYERHPPARIPSTRGYHLAISIFIVGAIILYAQKQTNLVRNAFPPRRYTALGEEGGDLPDLYAICSKQNGKSVLTVPFDYEGDGDEEGVGRADCVVVIDGEVVDAGGLKKMRRKWVTDTYPKPISEAMRIIDIPPGRTVTPGFIDSHGHPLVYGHSRQLQLHGSRSVAEVIEKVEAFVLAHPEEVKEGKWIQGLGWDQNLWDDKEFPTASDLDKSDILRGLPISLSRVDFHVEWVSSAILTRLGKVRDVSGGTVVRDEKGKPTGVFIDNAINQLAAIRPAWTDDDRERFLNVMLKDALKGGLTGVHDAQGFEKDQKFWRKMAKQGKLPIRFYNMLSCEGRDYCGDDIKPYDDFDNHYTLRAVKLFGDGALGSRGAALIDDYTDKPGWKGMMLKDENIWNDLIKKWYNAVTNIWQNVHTIGDRAGKVVLDAIAGSTNDPVARRDARFRLEHSQILTQEDIKRAAYMGVIASVQPTHATSDMWYAEDRLGPERIKGAYAWRSYLNESGIITLGSDFPVESIDPLHTFYAAVTRLSVDGTSPHGKEGWYKEQKLERWEALRGLTVGGAFASFSEDRIGSLTEGKRFDAVVWDRDLLTVPEDEILDAKVKAVIVDGQLVYGSI